jgi:hypothetical protein
MQRILLTFLFTLATLFSTSTSKAENVNLAGFSLGDKAEVALKVCSETLGYKVDVNEPAKGITSIFCEPVGDNLDNDEVVKKITKDKPFIVSVFAANQKIVSISLFFVDSSAYEKALANFKNSGIVQDGIEEVHSELPPQPVFKNVAQNWMGWYYTRFLDPESKKPLYSIHIEYAVKKPTDPKTK